MSTSTRHRLAVILLIVVSSLWPEQANGADAAPPPTAPATQVATPADAAPAEPASAPTEALLKLKDMPLPTAADLLTGVPSDWMVLNNDDVLVVEPLIPRPGTVAQRQQEIAAKTAERGKVLGEKRDLIDQQLQELNTLVVVPRQGTDRQEFRLPLKLVKQVLHHEDLMLRRINTLMDEQQLDQAYELLTRLERDRADWEGVRPAGLKLLLLSARQQLQQGRAEAALSLLDELRRRAPQDPEVFVVMGDAIRSLVTQALQAGDLSVAQHFLEYLRSRAPQHSVFLEFARQLSQQAREQMQLAIADAQAGKHRSALLQAELAVRTWPIDPELKEPYDRLARRYPRLHVGVTDLPGECKSYPLPGPADDRERQLTELQLFEIDRVRDGTAYYRTRYFDEWEPRDLGREMNFKLRQFRQPFEMQAQLTAPQLVAPILERLDPGNAAFDERLSAMISSVDVRSPTEFTLRFRRVPPRMEPVLARLSLLRSQAGTAEVADLGMDPGGFRKRAQTSRECEYDRVIPEPDGQTVYHIAEVVEHRYDSAARLVEGLRRGEISFAARLPDVELRSLQQDEELSRGFFIQPCLLPETHLLQFNPASEPLRISELRKALAYAVDADRLLKEVVLEDARAMHGRRVTTPFSSRNPGRHSGVTPRQFDLSHALALLLAARQKLKGNLPPLTMVVAPGAIPTRAAQEMAATWRKIGLEVQIVLAGDPAPPHWDLLYRTLEMTDPLLEMWPFLVFSEQARISELTPYPDWLKQELVQLDRIGDQGRAIEALQTLHKHLYDDTAFIPLWEVDQFVVLRKNVQGFPTRFVSGYDRVDSWRLDPWYREKLP